ncbi:hypothetical protein [Nocardia bovistercoris]|uniref:Uncharacterized protein n=1 Tax=Nocardia bovistercoris TaxID=2785916 RepID=A0A931N5V0_9NOCA|nr:hypothetical protein [Nocardia bovistercoris]MBH0780097.1 hypothetical protein [Nocardia bovistercoris]
MTGTPVPDEIGAALRLELALDTSSYADLRVEFLAMTSRAQRDSGLTKARIAAQAGRTLSKSTVYNYAGDPKYRSFPQPKQLTRYLEICGFGPEQVVFAVARCELIRILYPEGSKTPTVSPPAPAAPESVSATDPLWARYEQVMAEASAQIEALCADIEPGQVALGKVDAVVLPLREGQHEGQEIFLRRLFEMAGLPLPADVDFEPPLEMAALARVPVRPGDIVRTEQGFLGILAEGNRLIHLGRRGLPADIGLSDSLPVAAWRPTPGRRGHALQTRLHRVAATTTEIKMVGTPRSQPDDGRPGLDAVVALVCETVESAARHGVAVPVDGRAFFGAAVAHGVEFDYPTVNAWIPTPKLAAEPAPPPSKGAEHVVTEPPTDTF